jgi:glutamyl-tRNA synthetase
LEGETIIQDLVQGEVRLQNAHLDDRVLLRGDGTPTYMLSVVVDDHDMNVTHIIRGDDHLTNTFVQYHIYKACGWEIPAFAHIPLIHGSDGAKLSKRHGALGADAYQAMGYLPEALCNYLLRLGWGHGDDEIISREQAIEWFDLPAVGRSPSRFDLTKLTNLNAHYLREADNQRLFDLITPLMTTKLNHNLTEEASRRLLLGMNGLKQRAKTLLELANSAEFYVHRRPYDEKAQKIVTADAKKIVTHVCRKIKGLSSFTEEALEGEMRAIAEELGEKLGTIAQPLRVALTGSTISPSVFEIMGILGREECLIRLEAFLER